MQKIRNIVYSAPLIAAAWFAQAVDVNDEALSNCFEELDRLERLRCYDQLLARPQGVEIGTEEAPEPVEPAINQFARKVLNSTLKTEKSGTPVLYWDHRTGDELEGFGADFEEQIAKMTPEEFERFKLDTDFYFALGADESIGLPATLMMSCQNNITNLTVHYSEPLPIGFQNSVWVSDRGAGRDQETQTREVRIREEGFVVEAPRGVEAIRMIGWFAGGEKLQISVDTENDSASVFFDVQEMEDAKALLAKHCSWVQG